ncbi:uncharacterized protein LOC120349653 [Nilaparvata lugens]|uniref:uncharacterized protein LOC120349653 n=1 Tax=Nilaparvata lugens TaxID=108931 RepID=UPI00193D1047|nr:uncharacterized protein LOC120349653 [Nilaparvata lugens]
MIANGYSPNTKLKLLLTVICYLSRSNRFCARMVKVGLGQQVLRVFERWERFDGKMRYRICYYTLQTLQNLCSTSEYPYYNNQHSNFKIKIDLLNADCGGVGVALKENNSRRLTLNLRFFLCSILFG